MRRKILFTAIVMLGLGMPGFGGISLSTCCSGASISGSFGNYSTNLGNMNALALGTPSAGVSIYATGNGQLHSSPLDAAITTNGGILASQVQVSAKIYTSFTHASALDAFGVLDMQCGRNGDDKLLLCDW